MCPIKGLTDRPKSFLRLAKIKKGEKDPETGLPKDLDYFRLIFSYGCEDVEEQFREVYGDKPTRINMRLAFRSIPEVWDAFYVAYETGGLLAKAGSNDNGLYWVWYRDHDTKEVLVRDGHPVGTEGEKFISKKIDISQPVYSYKNKKTGELVPVYLEPEGRLSIVVPEMASVNGKPRVGFFEFCPGSPRDIGAISGELAAIDLWAKQVGKDITGIPMVLTRRKEMITKKINGVLSQGPSWVVHIEVSGEWGGKALESMEMKALPDNIVDGEVSNVEEGDFYETNEGEYTPRSSDAEEVDKMFPPKEQKKEEVKTGSGRPYDPETFRTKFLEGCVKIKDNYAANGKQCEATETNRKVLANALDTYCFKKDTLARHEFLRWLVEIDSGSTNDLSCEQVKAFLHIMKLSGTDFTVKPDGLTVIEIQGVQHYLQNTEG